MQIFLPPKEAQGKVWGKVRQSRGRAPANNFAFRDPPLTT